MALEEDVGPGDWTTEWTVPLDARGEAVVVAKADVIVAGTEPARRVFHRVDEGLDVLSLMDDGARVGPHDTVMQISGSLRSILTAERVALNFLLRLSGIATYTRRFVDAVGDGPTRILDTRKTTPGWRELEKAAVVAGGGANHRMGLHDMVLVKDNHLIAAGGVEEAVSAVKKANELGIEVEVEVGTLEELDELLPLGVDRVLLDNMNREQMGEAVRRIHALGPKRPLAEASGNMNLERVAGVAETGVDFISVGAITHSAPSADLSLRVLNR
jgi:nicotinate-nucleotide pyrophosphorylase (carboxylating)